LNFAAGVALQERPREAGIALNQAIRLKPAGGTQPFIQFLYGRALKDQDKKTDAARALEAATNAYEASMRSGNRLGDFEFCPLRFVSDWARPLNPGEEPRWITEAYRALGYVEWARSNKGAAVRAWETYLGRDPVDQTDVREVKRLVMSAKGHR
jgi:hypothetical protein